MIERRIAIVPFGSDEYEATFRLRRAVLLDPFDIAYPEEKKLGERDAEHWAIFEGHEVAACLFLVRGADARVQMRQVAVAAARQRQGLGEALVGGVERSARERGFVAIFAHARETAVGFYERLGYRVLGAPFVQVGLPHRFVEKDLLFV